MTDLEKRLSALLREATSKIDQKNREINRWITWCGLGWGLAIADIIREYWR